MADLRISDLPEMLDGQLSASDPIAIADTSASTTKRISAGALVADGIAGLPDGSIPGSKVDISVQPDSVGTAELKDGSVTGPKLAANSAAGIGASLPVSGDYVGQLFLVTAGEPQLFSWDGANWVAASGTIEVVGDTTGLVNTYSVTAGGITTVSADINGTTGAGQFLAGPAGSAGAVEQRQIASTDLPTAGVDKGAVAVTGADGLVVTGDVLSINNSVVANTTNGHLVQYDDKGLVTGGAVIGPADLPLSTDEDPGAVRPGKGLSVAVDGSLGIANEVTPGTFPKVTYDDCGLITAGQSLVEDDIPDISTDKIVSGTFPAGRIENRSIAEIKLADYSTAYVQEGQPSDDPHLGQFWFTPSTNQLRIYTRGSAGDRWESIGFGALQQQNLRWGGTVDASTSTITTVTDIGVSEGLEAGEPIPNPTDELSGLYFVVQVSGNAITIPNVSGDTCTEGDWILYIDQAQGALHLDISAGGGGGGGASKLKDLTDVDLNTVEDDQLLQYDAISGMWKNVSLISGGTF